MQLLQLKEYINFVVQAVQYFTILMHAIKLRPEYLIHCLQDYKNDKCPY